MVNRTDLNEIRSFLIAAAWPSPQISSWDGQMWAIEGLVIVTLVIYLVVIILRSREALQGRQSIWFFRWIHRSTGKYLIPNHLTNWLCLMMLYQPAFFVHVYSLIRMDEAGEAWPYVRLIISQLQMVTELSIGWFSVCSVMFSSLCTSVSLDSRGNERWLSTLPPPWVIHTIIFGLPLAWGTPVLIFLVRAATSAHRTWIVGEEVINLLNRYVAGDSSVLVRLLIQGQLLSTLAPETNHRVRCAAIADIVAGTLILCTYIPFSTILFLQLRRVSKEKKGVGKSYSVELRDRFDNHMTALLLHMTLVVIFVISYITYAYWAAIRGVGLTTPIQQVMLGCFPSWSLSLVNFSIALGILYRTMRPVNQIYSPPNSVSNRKGKSSSGANLCFFYNRDSEVAKVNEKSSDVSRDAEIGALDPGRSRAIEED